MRRPRTFTALIALLLAVTPLCAGAAMAASATAAGARTAAVMPTRAHPVTVSPASGGPRTAFTVRFRALKPAPGAVGRRLHYWISASGPQGSGCVASISKSLSAAGAGTLERARLGAARGWCRGTFHGRVVLVETPVCGGPQTACPMFVAIAATVGRFSFRVN